MTTKFIPQAFLCMSLLALVACGGGGSGSGGSSKNKNSSGLQESRSSKQHYRAVLTPMNAANIADTAGVVEIRIDGDDFLVEETVTDAPGDVRHFQAVMTGKSCAALDENQDGYIDMVEGNKAFGQRLIPLDSNLDSQIEGMDFGPISNPANAFIYRKSASFSRMLADLTATDPTDEDDLVKIGSEKSLKLAQRVVVVFGTDRALPDSVQGNMTYGPAEGLPLACGALELVKQEDSLPE